MKDINLRLLTENDLEMVRGWRNSPEVSQYMYTDEIIMEEQQKKWYQKIKDDPSSVTWIIENNGKSLGVASLNSINRNFSSCYWAFYLGDTTVRGGGIGAKVEFNVLRYVFEELKLNKLRCEVFNFNDKVIRMHEKFGFRREAYYREHCLKNGKFEDVVGLAILQSEWAQLKPILRQKIYGE
jgi:UDP-4-amino-4,6-dideoxy-N-acetyl-beta-L-altrosamine N-acetyltransferase